MVVNRTAWLNPRRFAYASACFSIALPLPLPLLRWVSGAQCADRRRDAGFGQFESFDIEAEIVDNLLELYLARPENSSADRKK